MANLDALDPEPALTPERIRERVAAAIGGYQPTARHRIDAERHAAKERRREKGLPATPVDLLRKTMDELEHRGYYVERVEWFDTGLRRRRDVFGCIDALAFREGEHLAVQATSWSNVSSRLNKMRSSPGLAAWLRSGGTAVCFGWRLSDAGRWEFKEIALT